MILRAKFAQQKLKNYSFYKRRSVLDWLEERGGMGCRTGSLQVIKLLYFTNLNIVKFTVLFSVVGININIVNML